jgi:hypothetical protein
MSYTQGKIIFIEFISKKGLNLLKVVSDVS